MASSTEEVQQKSSKSTFGQSLSSFVGKNNMYVILLGLFVLMVILTQGSFFSSANIINMIQSESGVGIMAIGVAFAIISGGIDLSLGSVVSLSSVVAGSFAQQMTYQAKIFPELTPFPAVIAAIIGLLVGACVGAINGSLIAYTKIHPFIATLGTMSLCRGFALLYTEGQPVSQLTEGFRKIGAYKIYGNITTIMVFFVIVAIIAWYLLNQTRFGRNVYAIGGNSTAARAAGINVERNLVAVYTFCSTCAAFSGVLMAARAGAGNPTLGLNMELDAIAAATIGGVSQRGGVGKISGVIAGIFILGIVKSALIYLSVSSYYQDIVKGAIIVLAVVIDMRKHVRSEN